MLAPVCGADGQDYRSECLAKKAGTIAVYEGSCDEMIRNSGPTSPDDTAVESLPTPDVTSVTSVESTGTIDETGSGVATDIFSETPPAVVTEVAPPTSLADVYGTGGNATGSLAIYATDAYHHYDNTYLNFSFAMPIYSYYQGYGARDGAAHTMAVALTAS